MGFGSRRLGLVLAMSAGLWISVTAQADPVSSSTSSPSASSPRRPRIGLVLSGGGARGLAEIGVLKALEEAGIPIDCIAGASMGAVVGGLYAAGVPADSLEKLAARPEMLRPPNSFADLTVYQKRCLRPRSFGLYFYGWEYRLPRSLYNDFNINWTLVEHAAAASLESGGDFDKLPIPFRTLALDLDSGDLIDFRSGDLARAIRSSMSVPVAFPPIPMRDPNRLLVDPGPRENLPIRLAREMGAERIIAVDCTVRWDKREVTGEASQVALQWVRVLSARVDSLHIKDWDVWIAPRVRKEGLVSFDHPEEDIKAGYQAAWSQMDRIRALFPPGTLPVRTRRCTVRDLTRDLGPLRLASVHLRGRSGTYTWVPRMELRLKPGDPFTLDALGQGLRRLYNTGHYESIWPSLARADSNQIAVDLDLEERAPTYVSLGLLYDNGRKANVDLEVQRDNLLHVGETLQGSLFLGNYYDGAEAGIGSSHVRGVPFGFDLLLRADRLRYIQSAGPVFQRRSRLVELSTSLPGGRDGLLLAGARLEREIGTEAEGVQDWNALDRILFGTLLVDQTDERVLPTRGERIRLHYEARQGGSVAPVVQSFSSLLSFNLPAGPLSFGAKGEVAGLSGRNPAFRHWHRLDLTHATDGRFEKGLYSPDIARGSFTVSLRPAANLSLWTTGTAGMKTNAFQALRNARTARGLEGGLLQRTSVGPVMLGAALEKKRAPFLFVQIGYDVPDQP